ncbi:MULTISPECIES: FMN-binding protein [unclassified Cryobacterium]|uniref:FMN-binding protein n=1 Tax=unclassified Cryobacterium TaxID=2649013 RepID=UPI00141B7321|nr:MULTISPECIES: FMN-binding protein [unclassified Cryobacterium]
MRIRAAAAAALASVSVLSVGWLVGAPAVQSLQATLTTTLTRPPSNETTGVSSTGGGTGGATTTIDASAPVAEALAPTSVTGTFEGSAVQTRFGPMQVSVTIDNGTITMVTPLQLTNDDRKSVQISNRAAPILRDEVLAAQSANVANVSGATYTTQGYLRSLQAALDAAQL